MHFDRLKSNDIPKVVRSLSKNCEDEEIANKARELVSSWSSLIPTDTPSRKKKKRERSEDAGPVKKTLKTKDSGEENSTSSEKATSDQPPFSPVLNSENEDQIANRPRTVKVKLGKSRNDLLTSDLTPSSKKKRSNRDQESQSKSHKIADMKIVSRNKALPGKSDKVTTEGTSEPGLSSSTSSLNVNLQPVSANKPQHTLKESGGFMEDITSVSSTLQKRKKKSEAKTTKQSSRDSDSSVDQAKTSSPISPVEDEGVASDEATDENSNSNMPIDDAPNPDDLPIPDAGPESFALIKQLTLPKSILTRRSSVNTGLAGDRPKNRVRWPAEDKIRQIRFFELDETERLHVPPSNTSDKRQSVDYKQKEGMELRKASRSPVEVPSTKEKVETRMEWKLRMIRLPQGLPLIQPGSKSEEKRLHAERSRNQTNLPLGADTGFINEPDLVEKATAEPKIIPLEDENTPAPEYSNTAQPQIRPGEFYRGQPTLNHVPGVPNHTEIRTGPAVQYQQNFLRPPYHPIPHDRPPTANYMPPNNYNPTVPAYGNPNLVPRQPGVSWASTGPNFGGRPAPRMRDSPRYPQRGPLVRPDRFYYHPNQPPPGGPNRSLNPNQLRGHAI